MCREQYGEYAYWCKGGAKGLTYRLPCLVWTFPALLSSGWSPGQNTLQSKAKRNRNSKFYSFSTISILALIIISGEIFSFDASNSNKNFFDHRHVERVWGASGDLWQGWWAKFHSLFGGDQFLLTVVGKRCNLHSHHFSNNFNVLLLNTFCNLPLSWTYHIWHRAK